MLKLPNTQQHFRKERIEGCQARLGKKKKASVLDISNQDWKKASRPVVKERKKKRRL